MQFICASWLAGCAAQAPRTLVPQDFLAPKCSAPQQSGAEMTLGRVAASSQEAQLPIFGTHCVLEGPVAGSVPSRYLANLETPFDGGPQKTVCRQTQGDVSVRSKHSTAFQAAECGASILAIQILYWVLRRLARRRHSCCHHGSQAWIADHADQQCSQGPVRHLFGWASVSAEALLAAVIATCALGSGKRECHAPI